jgi:hypothetical protein
VTEISILEPTPWCASLIPPGHREEREKIISRGAQTIRAWGPFVAGDSSGNGEGCPRTGAAFLRLSAGELAAVHENIDSRDVGGVVGREKERRVCDVFWRCQPLQSIAFDDAVTSGLGVGCAVDIFAQERCVGRAGVDNGNSR